MEAAFDPETIDLESAAAHYAKFDPWVCHTLLSRAHDEVAALEAAPTTENRLRRWRLHAIAATCVEFAHGFPQRPYYDLVARKLVNLHDLRNAQLLSEDPSLQSDADHIVDRLENILWMSELSRQPDFAQDARRVLALLIDAERVDLAVVVAPLQYYRELDAQILAVRAHDAVLLLEAAPTDANRPERWRLHALAAEAIEQSTSGNPMKPFYGRVNGSTVNLHDVRNAQLLREDPSLRSGFGAIADARLEYVQWLLDYPPDPASADPEQILQLLREPFVP